MNGAEIGRPGNHARRLGLSVLRFSFGTDHLRARLLCSKALTSNKGTDCCATDVSKSLDPLTIHRQVQRGREQSNGMDICH